MIDTILSLSLPALRAIFAIMGGARNDSDLRGAGVSRSCVRDATRELRERNLITSQTGRAAALGNCSIAATHTLTCKVPNIIVDVTQLTLAQARVLIAMRFEKHDSTRSLAKKCGLSEPSTRDALKFLGGKNLLSEHTAKFHGTPQSFTAHREVSQHTAEACSVTNESPELNTVLKEKEKQQTPVVSNFSIYQKLIENGIPKGKAAQFIARDKNECEIQIARLENLKNINNPPGFLMAAIANKYRDSITDSKNKANDSTVISKSDFVAHARDYRSEHEKLARSVGVPTISDSEKAWQQARNANPEASPEKLFKFVEQILSGNAA